MNVSRHAASRTTSPGASRTPASSGRRGTRAPQRIASEPAPAGHLGSRRLAWIMVIAAAGGLAAFPFRSPQNNDEPPTDLASPTGTRFAAGSGNGGLSDLESGPPLPERLPFANRASRGTDSIANLAPLPESRAAAPPTISSHYEPFVPPARLDPPAETFRATASVAPRDAARILPHELRQIAREGRWPVEARPIETAPPVIEPRVAAASDRSEHADGRAGESAGPPPSITPRSLTSSLPASFAGDARSISPVPPGTDERYAAGNIEPVSASDPLAAPPAPWRSAHAPVTVSDATSHRTSPEPLRVASQLPFGSSASGSTSTAASAAADSIQGVRPSDAAPRWRVYKVRDGDTMQSIAVKMLGDPTRAGELYEVNRDLLPPGGALPLGASIVIPNPQ